MTGMNPQPPVQPGELAPDFALSTVEPEGTVSLADYRGKSPVLLAINRGLWCSYCRRHIVQLARTREQLQHLGVETLAIVASNLERLRLYVRHRPLRVPLAADPDLVTHRAYGVPMPPHTPEIEQAVERMRVRLDEVAVSPTDLSELTAAVRAAPKDPTAGVEQPLPVWDFIAAQRRLYPYEMTESEQQAWTQWSRKQRLSTGQFLVDRDGVVRWARIQRMTDHPAGLGNYPSDKEFLAALQTLSA